MDIEHGQLIIHVNSPGGRNAFSYWADRQEIPAFGAQALIELANSLIQIRSQIQSDPQTLKLLSHPIRESTNARMARAFILLDQKQQIFKIITHDEHKYHSARRLTRSEGWKPVSMSADFSKLANLPDNHPTIQRIRKIASHYTNKNG